MAFDNRSFLKTEFVAREETLLLPALKDWFSEEPLWTVRGLDIHEVTAARHAAEKNNLAISVAEILANNDTDLIQTLKKELGRNDAVDPEIAQHLEYLVLGSVNPKITLPTAVHLANVRLVEFKMLVNKIVELTGLGMAVKKK